VKNAFFGETGPVVTPKVAPTTSPRFKADGAKPSAKDPRTPPSAPTGRGAESRDAASHHRVSVARMDDATSVVKLDQAILGYIHRAGTVYVALRGVTLGLAVEVGQSVSGARAFTLLHSDWRGQTARA
jgi:hypothetical protein